MIHPRLLVFGILSAAFSAFAQDAKPAQGAKAKVDEQGKPDWPKRPKKVRETKKPSESDPAATQEAKQPEPAPDKKDGKASPPPPAVTKHELHLAGKRLAYAATAGTMVLSKPGGEPRANVFYVAYTADGTGRDKKQHSAADRPLTFCFNGGPGSSAVWLHLGAFGPRRVVLPDGGITPPKPPFELTDNEECLLDATDLVFVDPVSTGYSRPEKGEDPKQFHGFNEDVESVGDFIRLYVSKNQRWASPKFIMGESYGAIRCGGLADHLQSRYGMYLNGLIIVSGLWDFQTLDANPPNDLPFICYLPTMAAAAHYHKKLPPVLQQDFAAAVKQADEFAHGAYAAALLKGAGLSAEEKQNVAQAVAYFTGLPADFILRENLRISPGQFFRKLLESEDKVVGRFDARVTGDPEVGDPSFGVVFGAFASTLNDYVRRELKVENDQPYEILSRQVQPWNYQPYTNRYLSVSEAVASAMKTNPALRIYIACGWYDMATPFCGIRHSVRHMNLDEKQRTAIQFGFYEGGHMMYTNLPELRKLSGDLRQFLQAAPDRKRE
ncbi:MAG: peptidase S10 [Verrucomicrobiales bacterium]|nr:peptidase S10 [Verrucomicrobiales bacterium]